MTTEELPDILKLAEAQHYLRVSRHTMREAVRSGRLRVIRMGRAWRVSRAALERFIQESETRGDAH
jgi:excisionase family DNA binding protein